VPFSHRFMRIAAVCLSMLVVASCATVPTETPYNLGVDAYKKKNYPEAAAQWNKAVGQGDTAAMNNLAYLLYNGYGVDKDVERAVNLWRVASAAGESESQWHLGMAYETGVGTERNLAIAYAWYQCGIANASRKSGNGGGDADLEASILSDVTQSRDKLQAKLNAEELQKGQALAIDYIARYGKRPP